MLVLFVVLCIIMAGSLVQGQTLKPPFRVSTANFIYHD